VGADGQGVAAPRRRGPVVAATIARIAAGATAILALYTAFTLPPRQRLLRGDWPATHVPGAVHVHTARAGGSGTADDIAAAAARAGLKFVVFTDHGDATRPPDPPAYRHGVLCIDAVEIGTDDGHLVALGLDAAAPYPLAGAGIDVVEDVHRLGGVAVAAHPDSPNPELAWRGPAAVDGFEWLNADSEWRDESRWTLTMSLPRLFIRPAETIVSLFDRPTVALARWDALLRTRDIVTMAAGDAHARVGRESAAGEPVGFALRAPSYEAVFRALAQVAIVEAPLSGDAMRDAAAVVDALATGRSYSAITGIASPAPLEFVAEQSGRTVGMGQSLTADRYAIVTVRTPTLPFAGIALAADGRVDAVGRGSLIAQRPMTARAYRVEVYFPGVRVPWIVSNPIFVRRETVSPLPPAAVDHPQIATSVPLVEWNVEHDASSTARITRSGATIDFDAALGAGAPAGQFAAAVAPVPAGVGVTGVRLTARASSPLRLSIQLRAANDGGGDVRWRRSIYVDETPRTFDLPLASFRPIRHDRPLTPTPGLTRSLLIVVDTLNSRTGSRAAVQLSDVALMR
jgi:hypothetical protein